MPSRHVAIPHVPRFTGNLLPQWRVQNLHASILIRQIFNYTVLVCIIQLLFVQMYTEEVNWLK